MTDKTKAKIEALAIKGKAAFYDESIPVLRSEYIKGATPWAKWCERFHQICGPMAMLMEDGNLPDLDSQGVTMMIEVFNEYRQWLDDASE